MLSITENRELNIEELYNRDKFLKSKPVFINLPTGTRCNLKCIFCTDRSSETPFIYENLSSQTIISLLSFTQRASALGLYGWGEPLYNSEYKDVIRYLIKNNPEIFIHITTNGTLLTRPWRDLLIEKNHISLNISLNASNWQQYKLYTGFNLFERTIKNIKNMLKEMKEKEADDIYLTTSAVLIKDNLYKINEFIKISAELGVDAVQIIPLMVLTKEHRELYVDWSGEQAQSVFDDAKSYAEDNKIFLHFFKNFENASIGSIDICSQPWTTLYIDQNGDSYPCCFTKKSLGNVKTTNLEEVWNGEIAQSFRSNVAQRNTSFEGCINCPSMGGKGYKYIL